MLSKKRQKGNYGETIAVGILESKGYKILERNYKRGHGEIDIIAMHFDCLVFIEVKYRKNFAMGYPRNAVTKPKQQNIIEAAEYYLSENNINGLDMRFDVIEIIGETEFEFNIIENAFML